METDERERLEAEAQQLESMIARIPPGPFGDGGLSHRLKLVREELDRLQADAENINWLRAPLTADEKMAVEEADGPCACGVPYSQCRGCNDGEAE